MEEKIKEIYSLSVSLYYEVADDNMKHRGHPGIMGPSSAEQWDENIGMINGIIQTLIEILNKINSQNYGN